MEGLKEGSNPVAEYDSKHGKPGTQNIQNQPEDVRLLTGAFPEAPKSAPFKVTGEGGGSR